MGSLIFFLLKEMPSRQSRDGIAGFIRPDWLRKPPGNGSAAPGRARTQCREPCRLPQRSPPGRGAAQAVHADGKEQRCSLRRDVQHITNDGILFNLNSHNMTSCYNSFRIITAMNEKNKRETAKSCIAKELSPEEKSAVRLCCWLPRTPDPARKNKGSPGNWKAGTEEM